MNILTLNKKITDRQRKAFWLAFILFNLCVQSLKLINSELIAFLPLEVFSLHSQLSSMTVQIS